MVYVDLCPTAIDGSSALSSPWRLVAGDIGTWSGTGNNQYQIFGIHVQRPDLVWENYGWILLGHIDAFKYPTYNQIVISARTTCGVAWVGDIAAVGTWPTHVHMEAYNYAFVSRTYEWDGPSNADQPDSSPWGPACNRTANPAANDCEPMARDSDAIGYIGGNKSTFAELDNPYYAGF